MNNTLLKIRFGLLATFGLIPSAESIEKKEQETAQEYEKLKAFRQSNELARYQELKQWVGSEEYKKRKKEINAERYKGSEPHQKEQRFKKLIRKDPLRTYLKVKDSKKLQHYLQTKDSQDFKRFLELRDFFESAEFDEFKKSLEDKKKNKKQYHKKTLSEYNKLQKKYGWYHRFRESNEYAHYLDLKDSDQIRRYDELAQTRDGRKSPEYKSLKKDSDTRSFLKTRSSKKLARFESLHGSQPVSRLEELHEEVHSEQFASLPDEIQQLDFKQTDEYRSYQEYKKLKRNRDIKKALRFQDSKKYSLYQQALDSDELEEYRQLKDYFDGDDFKEKKNYLKQKNKFKLSQEYEWLREYENLRKSDQIKWYFANRDSHKFDFLRQWERSFHDDFQTGELDAGKWLTSYYWGKALLNESYVQATDHHFFTDGNNIRVDDGVLRIITRKEQVEGKVWHPSLGFYPRTFEYTSGIINTGQSFRQKYGIFRTKARLNHARNIRHSFWLVPDKILPEIDVFSYSRNPASIDLNAYSGDVRDRKSLKTKKSRIGGYNFSKRYVIYELDWQPKKLIWKINGVCVRKQKKQVPDEPMYMILNSGVNGPVKDSALPGEMLVDWVEAYRHNKEEKTS